MYVNLEDKPYYVYAMSQDNIKDEMTLSTLSLFDHPLSMRTITAKGSHALIDDTVPKKNKMKNQLKILTKTNLEPQ